MHCFIASGSARPVMGMAGPAGKRPSGGLKPVYRGERLVSSATAKGEGKDDKFWGKGLTPEQLAFLERKCARRPCRTHALGATQEPPLLAVPASDAATPLRCREKAARGQGPVMPVSTQCKRCDGQGVHLNGRASPALAWSLFAVTTRARLQGCACATTARGQVSTRRTRTWAARWVLARASCRCFVAPPCACGGPHLSPPTRPPPVRSPPGRPPARR